MDFYNYSLFNIRITLKKLMTILIGFFGFCVKIEKVREKMEIIDQRLF